MTILYILSPYLALAFSGQKPDEPYLCQALGYNGVGLPVVSTWSRQQYTTHWADPSHQWLSLYNGPMLAIWDSTHAWAHISWACLYYVGQSNCCMYKYMIMHDIIQQR